MIEGAPSASPSPTSVEAKPLDRAKLREAAQAFEAVFLRQMISSMRSASLGEDILGSSAGDQFRDMADARIADSMAGNSAFGIAELLIRQFDPPAKGSAQPAAAPDGGAGLSALTDPKLLAATAVDKAR